MLYITYISGTNTGKSTIFFLSSYILQSKIIFVILPRISLLSELYARSKELKLNSVIFDARSNQNYANNYNLIFINIDSIQDKRFDSLVLKCEAINKDIIVFLDEAHLLISEASFRNTLSNLAVLKLGPSIKQIVLLTATLPTLLLKLLQIKLNITSNYLIRNSTTRYNIKYSVINVSINDNYYKTLLNSINIV